MFLKMTQPRWLFAAILISLALSSEASAARKLYLITVADTKDPTIGKHAETDLGEIRGLFSGSIAASDFVMVNSVQDLQATENGILKAINDLKPTPDDAVLLYYSGHGVYGNDNKHYLVTQNGKDWTHRQVLVDAMQKKGFGLVVLMTDCCFNFSTKPPLKSFRSVLPPPQTSLLFQTLFFQTNGLIDVTSAKKGQVAGTFAEAGRGSLYTSFLCRTMRARSQDGNQTWDSILDEVGKETRAEFRRLYPDGHEVETATGIVNQRDQQLAKLTLSVKPYTPGGSGNGGGGNGGGNGGGGNPPVAALPSVRLGVTVRNQNRPGVLITAVAPGGPATKCFDNNDGQTYKLERGDFILAINGTEISNVNEFASEIRNSDRVAQLTVEGNAGDVHEFTTQLNSLNGGGGKPNGGGGKPVPNKGTRFGAFVTTNGNRVRVTGIVPDSPASRCLDADGETWALEDGDIISRVNGQVVSDEQEFRQAINESPQEMTLELRGTNGRTYRFTCTLNY